MSYKIEYSYRTGDSFSSNDATGILELEWNDLNVAKANLKRIQEHYRMYEAMHSYFDKRSNQEIIKSFEGNDWLVSDKKLAAFKNEKDWWCIDKRQIPACEKEGYKIGEVYDETMSENCLKLFTDAGKVFQLWAPWCGYFEQLYGAKVIVAVDPELEFTV